MKYMTKRGLKEHLIKKATICLRARERGAFRWWWKKNRRKEREEMVEDLRIGEEEKKGEGK